MTNKIDILILGGGISGLATSRWVINKSKVILEAKEMLGGHLCTEKWADCSWDQGPHVSFTKNKFVKDIFSKACDGEYAEFVSKVLNYDRGMWFGHPVQSFLYELPSQIRDNIVSSFRKRQIDRTITSYQDWLHVAYGEYFSKSYMERYNVKYWTCETNQMGTEWIGPRLKKPTEEEIVASTNGPQQQGQHYISLIRYPLRGGFYSYLNGFIQDAPAVCGDPVCRIDLDSRVVETNNAKYEYDKLISTIPLPDFIAMCCNVPEDIRRSSALLKCTSIWLVDVKIPHIRRREFHWAYVYDADKLSTRLTQMEALASSNVPQNCSAIQIEVYESDYRPLRIAPHQIMERVINELIEMGLLDPACKEKTEAKIRHIKYGNIIYDFNQKAALESIWSWLELYGLIREQGDTDPLTNWEIMNKNACGEIAFVGRYGQWKYYWTDDCILRAKNIAERINDESKTETQAQNQA